MVKIVKPNKINKKVLKQLLKNQKELGLTEKEKNWDWTKILNAMRGK